MKRFLAILLIMLMCMSMLPASAFAEAADLEYDDQDYADIEGNQIDGHTHNLTYVSPTDPNCKAGNIGYYQCSECKRLFSDSEGKNEVSSSSVRLPAVHVKPTVSGEIKTTQPTCTRNGKIEYTCTECNATIVDVLKAHGAPVFHNAVAPTCTSSGNQAYYQCSACGRTYADESATQEISVGIVALGHMLERVPAKDATCNETGNIEYWKCTREGCGAIFSDEAAATPTTLEAVTIPQTSDHELTKRAAVAATCAHSGNIDYWECSVCGKLFSNAEATVETNIAAVTIPALSHTLTKTDAVAATCEESGNIDYWTCSACGIVFSDAAATTKAQSINVAKLGHALKEVEAKPACLKDGNIQYWICERDGCGKLFLDEQGTTETTLEATIVKAVGHHDFDGGFCKNCKAKDPEYKGPVFKDSNLSFTPGQDLVIRVDADYDTTVAGNWSVTVNGETIPAEYVTITKGSSVFTVSGSALESLAAGKYPITITTTQGTVTGELEVKNAPTTYNVKFATITNGEVTADNTTPQEGETVTLTVKPASGYKLDTLSVKDEDGAGITVSNNTFKMPAKDVTVSATFKQVFKVTFDTVLPISTISGTPPVAEVPSGDKVTKPSDPSDTTQHHKFLGWYKDAAYKTAFDFSKDTITADTTIYAKWKHPYDEGICRYCWKAKADFKEVEDPAFKAAITQGIIGKYDSTAHYGSSHSFIVNTYFPYVEDSIVVKIDGHAIASDRYVLKSGSTVVTLRPSYIRTLAVGQHTVDIGTNLGNASGTFRVSSSPKTGDDSNVALYVTVGVISAAAVAGIAYYLVKKRKK